MKKIFLSFVSLILTFFLVACGGQGSDFLIPDFSTKTKFEIEEILLDNKISYEIKYEIDFEKNNNEFIKIENHELGEVIQTSEKLVLYFSQNFINLPDLKDKTKPEIIQILKDLKFKDEYFFIKEIIKSGKPANKFIDYGKNLKTGDKFTPSLTNKLIINVDFSIYLEDFSGKHYIEAQNKYKTNFEIVIEEVIDNTKEYDTFAGYGDGLKVGDIAVNDRLVIRKYVNDNLDEKAKVFLSKYLNITSNNKKNFGFEIYNGTEGEINLSNYYVALYKNRQLKPYKVIELKGTLESKKTYFITSSFSEEVLKNKSQFIIENFEFGDNEQIKLHLKENNTFIDSIYTENTTNFTLFNEVFVRRHNVTKGQREFNLDEWAGFIPTFFDPIGIHPYKIETKPEFIKLDGTFQQYGMTLVETNTIYDGDTISFTSLDPNDTTSYTGNGRVRFLMVDTPETPKPEKPGDPYSITAWNFTKSIMNKAVEVYLQASRANGLKENYGRHLGLIWAKVPTTGGNHEWLLVNFELLRNGLGESAGTTKDFAKFEQEPVWGNRYMYQWANDAYMNARDNKLGIYSGIHQD